MAAITPKESRKTVHNMQLVLLRIINGRNTIQTIFIFFKISLTFPLTFKAFFIIIQSSTKTMDTMDYLVL